MPKYNIIVENKTRYAVQASGEDIQAALDNYLNGDYAQEEEEAKADVAKRSESSSVVMVYSLSNYGSEGLH